MRISVPILFLICAGSLTLLAASSRAQSVLDKPVTVDAHNITVDAILDQVSSQAKVNFTHGSGDVFETKISIKADKEKLGAFLNKLFKGYPYSYTVIEDNIIVKEAPEKLKQKQSLQQSVTGKVTDEKGQPLSGASVKVKGTQLVTVTNAEGRFSFASVQADAVLIVSFVGYQQQEVPVNKGADLTIVLQASTSALDEVVIIPYGTTTARLNTGSIGKITADEISMQPVSNPLAALEGRIAGLSVTSQSGLPGSSFKVQIRGQNSILNGNDPLFIIDGVPFAANNNVISQVSSALDVVGGQGLSPFASVNPSDIESIDVLKDADATAIYGSRGANGVILITTKSGKAGNTKVDVNFNSGFSQITRIPQFMNTTQYLQMRHEAFKNDGLKPDLTTAPDIIVWDTTRYTNFAKTFFGNTSRYTNANASVSGGDINTQFLISGTYRRETNVFENSLSDNMASLHLSVNNSSKNKKFKANISLFYTYDRNAELLSTPNTALYLPPDLPQLADAQGNLQWYSNGVHFNNPLAAFNGSYVAQTHNLNSSLLLSYELVKGLTLKTSLGYSMISIYEENKKPSLNSDPELPVSRYANYGHNDISNWNVEPQIEYIRQISKGKLDVLIGGTWLNNDTKSSTISALGFSSDALLGSLASATSNTLYNDYAKYRYQAVFSRINYNWDDRYIINLTGRRDGSSRFGENNLFSNFGAVGAAWLFTNEHFIKDNLSFLSYGKLRGSYGITGSDQIGNYQYLDSWSSTLNPYNGSSAIQPTRLANNQYGWEVNKKMEGGLELGFLKDRILISAAYFRNRSGNQLVNYNLPSQTGFTSITENLPALVQNTGLELTASIRPIEGKIFNWDVNFNLTIPKNKLIAFPGIETSSYFYTYLVGKSLSYVQGYQLNGVDPTTGIYKFADANSDGVYDTFPITDLAPKYYGGLSNTFSYKNLRFDIFFEFKKQMGLSYLSSVYINSSVPGMMRNLPAELLSRWQKPGDISDIQRLTSNTSTTTYTAGTNFSNTNSGLFTDASYIRLKTARLAFILPTDWTNKIRFHQANIYCQGQNLLTLTQYKVGDPETQNLNVLPPLRTVTFGIQFTL